MDDERGVEPARVGVDAASDGREPALSQLDQLAELIRPFRE